MSIQIAFVSVMYQLKTSLNIVLRQTAKREDCLTCFCKNSSNRFFNDKHGASACSIKMSGGIAAYLFIIN